MGEYQGDETLLNRTRQPRGCWLRSYSEGDCLERRTIIDPVFCRWNAPNRLFSNRLTPMIDFGVWLDRRNSKR